jgi:hypothetical protein
LPSTVSFTVYVPGATHGDAGGTTVLYGTAAIGNPPRPPPTAVSG